MLLTLRCVAAAAAAALRFSAALCYLRPHNRLTLEFDNRGSKVQGKEKAMIAALSKAFGVPPSQVSSGGVIGQSTLFNHQSVASFTITGPSSNGKSAYDNCLAVVKKGWFTKSQLSKDVNKASDSWMPGDCKFYPPPPSSSSTTKCSSPSPCRLSSVLAAVLCLRLLSPALPCPACSQHNPYPDCLLRCFLLHIHHHPIMCVFAPLLQPSRSRRPPAVPPAASPCLAARCCEPLVRHLT